MENNQEGKILYNKICILDWVTSGKQLTVFYCTTASREKFLSMNSFDKTGNPLLVSARKNLG